MSRNRTRGKQPGRRRTGTTLFIVAIVMVSAVVFLSPWLDAFGERWVGCEVLSAQAVKGNNRSVSPWRVEIETADCRTIAYLKAPTQAEAEALASHIEPGMEHEFKLGIVSSFMTRFPAPLIMPSAKDLRPVEGTDGALVNGS